MPDDALEAVARIKEEMVTSANALVPGLGPVRAYAAGRLHTSALTALAGIEAALVLHKPIDRGCVMACCEGCESVNGEFHEDCCHEWPCPTHEAILAALTGKAADHG